MIDRFNVPLQIVLACRRLNSIVQFQRTCSSFVKPQSGVKFPAHIAHLPNSSLLGLLGTVFTPARRSVRNTTLFTPTLAINLVREKETQGNQILTRSNAPRTRWYRTPGQSCDLPPRTSTTLCCWMLCPSPGMYAVTT